MAACGPGPIPPSSTTRSPVNGPGMSLLRFGDVPTDDPLHDLGRATVAGLDARIDERLRDRVLEHIAVAAVSPQAAVDDAFLRLCRPRSEEHTSELQSRENLVCRLLLEKKNVN